MKKLILSMLLVGCGTQIPDKKELITQAEETKTTTESPKAINPPMTMTVSGEKPACSPENENQLIYSVDDQGFFTCSKNDWVAIDIKGKEVISEVKGKDGLDGADGVDGKDGIDGVNGQDLTVIHSWSNGGGYTSRVSPGDFALTIYNIQIQEISNGDAQVMVNGDKINMTVFLKGCRNMICQKTFKLTNTVDIEFKVQFAYPGFRLDEISYTVKNGAYSESANVTYLMGKD